MFLVGKTGDATTPVFFLVSGIGTLLGIYMAGRFVRTHASGTH